LDRRTNTHTHAQLFRENRPHVTVFGVTSCHIHAARRPIDGRRPCVTATR